MKLSLEMCLQEPKVHILYVFLFVMKILLVSATRFEVKPLADRFENIELIPSILHKLRFDHLEIDLLTTGIGMVQTAFCLGKHMTPGSYDLAINAGICGAYSKDIPIGSVIHVIEECIPEAGVEQDGRFLSLFEAGLLDPDEFPFDQGKLINVNYPKMTSLEQLNTGRGNTVITLQTDPGKINRLKTLFPADVESMEGAAFLWACMVEDVVCTQIRAVSNLVGERDKSKWDIRAAVKNLDVVLAQLFKEIGNYGLFIRNS